MSTLYLLLKFVHIVAAATWIGSLVAVGIQNARRGDEHRLAVQASARQSRLVMTFVRHPAAIVTVLAGIATMAIGGLAMSLWIVWGLAAMVASGLLGALALQRGNRQLLERSAVVEH